MELNESRNISIDFEKANSLSSDEGSSHGLAAASKAAKYSQSSLVAPLATQIASNQPTAVNFTLVNQNNYANNNSSSSHHHNSGTSISSNKGKTKAISSSTLDVKHNSVLRQSLPNLNLNSIHNSHSNTLLVPGTASTSSGHCNLLSPSHRGISYPPPSPTRFVYRFVYFCRV